MQTVYWDNGVVRMIDQTRLPHETVILTCEDYRQVARAISEMRVRGAPAIGVTAAFGLALGAQQSKATDVATLLSDIAAIASDLKATRPTAVNLFWAIERMRKKAAEVADKTGSIQAIRDALLAEALRMADEDVTINKRMGAYGAILIKDGDSILTHCNTGGLATVDYGTALGVIRTAWEQGKRIHVFVDETRPFLQGARLTAWELMQLGIPMTLITDNMAGHFMARGRVHLVAVGADRIAANGDVANKIGTYSLAILAKEHGIPFYVVAPTSTIDMALPSGDDIPIEERDPNEVTTIRGIRIAPEGVQAAHPAFDVTPHRYITAIVTENGIARQPYQESLVRLVHRS
jgi:methylthioribose-1-phosphate isomerase